MTFVARRIDVTITLGTGTNGETVGDTVTLTGHRVIVDINASGGDQQGQLFARIYGLPIEMINRLTSIGPVQTQIRGKNSIQIAAGDDDGSALTTIYLGTIDTAWGDFQSAPDVALNITALSALAAAVKPVAAVSYKGAADVPTIMKALADTMGFAFTNNGVAGSLSNPYFYGTALEQMRQCARAANIQATVDNGNLVIWPRNGARASAVPIISPDTGMIGYPRFSSGGLELDMMFRPEAILGGQINVQSAFSVASGVWNTYSVQHRLESLKPGGAWFTSVKCYRPPT